MADTDHERALRNALAGDLATFSGLFAAELSLDDLRQLRDIDFPACLGIQPDDPAWTALAAAFRQALADDLQKNSGDAGAGEAGASLDELSADYAGIFLTGAYQASPYESVWYHDERLTCQEPMFELRKLYEQAGLKVDNWRHCYDDHFCLQFQYLAHRLQADAGWGEIGEFLDHHVGHWFGDFAQRVVSRANTAFYATLAALNAAWLERFRQVVELAEGMPRVPREQVAASIQKKFARAAEAVAPIKFMPGVAGPSW